MILKVAFGKQIHIISSVDSYNQLILSLKSSFKELPQYFTISYTDNEGDKVSIDNQQDLNILKNTFSKEILVKVTIQQSKIQKLVTLPSVAQKTGFFEVIQDDDISESPQLIKDASSDYKPVSHEEKEKEKKKQPEPAQTKAEKKVIHTGIKCNDCSIKEIQGTRYQCMVCESFNLCQSCQSKGNHPHPFIKFRNPLCDQVPKNEKPVIPHKKQQAPKAQNKKQQIYPPIDKKNSEIDIEKIEFSSEQQKNQIYAQYLSSIVGSDPQQMLKFVQSNKQLNVSQLATKWFEKP